MSLSPPACTCELGDGKQPSPGETLCYYCWLLERAQAALDKNWMNQYHMIQGMIRDLNP